jgi:hypothetical protein
VLYGDGAGAAHRNAAVSGIGIGIVIPRTRTVLIEGAEAEPSTRAGPSQETVDQDWLMLIDQSRETEIETGETVGGGECFQIDPGNMP